MTPEDAQALVGREVIHFQGNRYRLLSIAKQSETLEPFVVYQALYGEHGVWVRPFATGFPSRTAPSAAGRPGSTRSTERPPS